MRWKAWTARVARLQPSWTLARRVIPTLATILVVTALAVTFYGLTQAQRRLGSDSTTTTTASAHATATSSAPTSTATGSPLSPPPPTAQPGGHPVIPSNGSGPFKVVAVEVADACGIYGGNCGLHVGCPINPQPITGVFWMAPNAPAGDVTYRWHVSDGRVTAPQVVHFDGQTYNNPTYEYQPIAAIADGRDVTFQLEILSPNQMISPPSTAWHMVCMPWIKGENVGPFNYTTPVFYNCAIGGTQTFSFTGSVDLAPSPSFTFSYYWKHPDGSVSATRQVTTTAGATNVALQGDSISLTAPSPPPPPGPSPIWTVSDVLVVLNPPTAMNGSQVSQYTVTSLPVNMPNCSDPVATPTPTPTSTSTPTPAPTSTP